MDGAKAADGRAWCELPGRPVGAPSPGPLPEMRTPRRPLGKHGAGQRPECADGSDVRPQTTGPGTITRPQAQAMDRTELPDAC